MRPFVFVCCWLIGIYSPRLIAGAQPVGQSTSATRQFVVYGTDAVGRGAICDFAEQTKRELLTLLGRRDEWAAPIIINAEHSRANLPEAPPLSVGFSQTGFGVKLQLDLVLDSGVSRREIRRELLRALILEMIYRAQPNLAVGTPYVSPADWFLEGVPAPQPGLTRDRVAAILAVPVAAKNVLPLKKFLEQKPELLDGPGRNLYHAYAFALVDLLRRSPDGPRQLTRFLFDLPAASNDRMAELKKHFPGVFNSDEVESTWQNQVAHISTDQPYQLLGIAETERQLGEVLRLRMADRDKERSCELAQFPVLLKSKSAKRTLGTVAHDLAVLATRAHPLYAPIIAGHAEVTTLLVRGKTLDVPRRLDRLEKTRKAIGARMHEIDDYLNWFEATSLAGPSGAFTDYMSAAERAAQPERTKRDPISVYLDALQTQFEK